MAMNKKLLPLLLLFFSILTITPILCWGKTLIGIFEFDAGLYNHIHVAIKHQGTEAIQLNVWSPKAIVASNWQRELNAASHYVIFETDQSEKDIIDQWTIFYSKYKEKFSLLHYNCAFGTRYFLKKILKLKLPRRLTFSHVYSFICLPSIICPIPLADSVLADISYYLIKNKIPHSWN